MKLTVLIIFGQLIAIIVSIRQRQPPTTPSPLGSARFKLFKCQCTERAFKEFLDPNYKCFAKAHSRDLSIITAFVKFKKDFSKLWLSATLEHKDVTAIAYKTVIDMKQVEICDLLTVMDKTSNQIVKPVFQVLERFVPPEVMHPCPYKAGEAMYVNNLTVPVELMPSVLKQGDYRATIRTYLPTADELICNNTIIYSITSPYKESFG